MLEQRRSRRFELRLPVEVICTGKVKVKASGETVNLSSNGVLLTTPKLVPVGEAIEYLITLPSAEGEPVVRLRCMGKIVRLEPECAAVTLERYEFVRAK